MRSTDKVDYNHQLPVFEAWYQTALGRQLLADQRHFVDELTGGFSGAHQLVVTVSHRLPLATGNDFGQRMMTTNCWSRDLGDGVVVCDGDELPFPGESMDLVVLHHTHDFSERPHQVVREAARVLRSCGRLLIIGFNPFSSWGLRKLVTRSQQAPWSGRFVARGRLEDWLRLLEFEVEQSLTRFYRLPIRPAGKGRRKRTMERVGQRLHLPGGAYYGVLAEKKVAASVDTKTSWRQLRPATVPVAGSLGAARTRGRAINRESTETAGQARLSKVVFGAFPKKNQGTGNESGG
jgi:SAM-dependent methyltransferase